MKADIVIGGQYGSEGKGKICGYLASLDIYDAYVRGGSENAGHTFYDERGNKHVVQVLPCGAYRDEGSVYIAPAATFSLEQLFKEMDASGCHDRLLIDRNASIIESHHVETERAMKLGDGIGSTVHGCGAARAAKLMRSGVTLASDVPELRPHIGNVPKVLHRIMNENGRVFVEGAQGTLLSVDHTMYYPYATSRNGTAIAFASECGLGHQDINEVIMVVRSYPIRVGGNSGPAEGEELTWEELARRNNTILPETTTVTGKNRRIFEWSWAEYEYALMLNTPTRVAYMFADYVDERNAGVTIYNNLVERTKRLMSSAHKKYGVSMDFIGTGKFHDEMVVMADMEDE